MGDDRLLQSVHPERWQRAIDDFLDTVDGQNEETGVRQAASIALCGTAALLGAIIATRCIDPLHARVLLEQARLAHESQGKLLASLGETLLALEVTVGARPGNGHHDRAKP